MNNKGSEKHLKHPRHLLSSRHDLGTKVQDPDSIHTLSLPPSTHSSFLHSFKIGLCWTKSREERESLSYCNINLKF